MNDAVQDFRISALERALTSLTGGASLTGVGAPGYQQPNPPTVTPPTVVVAQPASDAHQEARIVALENAVVALSNSVALLNQQMTSLTAEMQKQNDAANMITITPSAPVDAAQNARLDGIDSLVENLAKNVADYNQQMSALIAQYQSLKPRPKAATKGNGIKAM